MFSGRFGEFLELKLATRLRLSCRGRLTGIKLSPTGIDFESRRRRRNLNLGKLWRRRLFSARESNDHEFLSKKFV